MPMILEKIPSSSSAADRKFVLRKIDCRRGSLIGLDASTVFANFPELEELNVERSKYSLRNAFNFARDFLTANCSVVCERRFALDIGFCYWGARIRNLEEGLVEKFDPSIFCLNVEMSEDGSDDPKAISISKGKAHIRIC